MVFKSIIGATCACLAVISFNTNAVLVSRLGGLAYYDDVADLTWLADANYAQTSGYDPDANGNMRWDDSTVWASSLVVAGVTGWRLPTTEPTGLGYYQIDSELGNLFYSVLGGSANSSITSTHNDNYNFFSNVQPGVYWTTTMYTPIYTSNTDSARWGFNMSNGWQDTYNPANGYYAWAVHDGDIGAVPIPSAVWLFGSGLLGLIGFARSKK